MKNTLRTLALGFLLVASGHPASATPTPIAHTYVSAAAGNSDINPCTRSQPCSTFQGAFNRTLAGGVITAIDSGEYGPITVTQAVTIDGTGTQASIVATAQTSGITMDCAATDIVILRHLRLLGLTNANTGIRQHSGALVMEDCKISGFGSGLYVYSTSLPAVPNTAIVENTVITGCSVVGIANFSLGLVTLRHVTIQGNNYGLDVQSGQMDISHSLITQNLTYGLDAAGSTLSASGCMISGNGTAVNANTGATIRLTGNDLFNNTTGIATNGNGIVSTAGNNHKAGSTTPGAPTSGKVIVTQ